MSLQPGQAFGNYRIISRIGVGGMGMVFLAEHPHIGKKVALKVIHRELAGNKEVVSRFLNEARAVNQIGNEHIVEIHDFGQTDDGQHFFIMEYLDGRTLAADLSAQGGGGLAIPRGLHIGAQIASGLATAHDRGIIHRDLKPDNVMLIERLGDQDFVKLLDFGLAKFLVDADARKLTAAGVVLGTPQYMSPEACESRPGVDHRSDIYSLGILLFQMLTGALPFSGDSMGEVLVKQVAHPPPGLRAINPEVPPAVEQVVLRCLAKDPAGRFQHMLELRDALLDPNQYLASSPPVVAVAAAPDARTMYAADAARRSTEQRKAAAARTIAAMSAPPAPAARPTEIAPAAGGPGEPPAVEPGAPGQDASPGRSVRPSDAPTAYMDSSAHRMFAGHMQLNVPQPVSNRTMEIGTPHGYRNHPPRRWPMVLLLLAVIGGGAAIAAVAVAGGWFGEAEGEGGGAAAPPPDAGAAIARISLTTRPPGASVYDEQGRLHGTTPIVLELPVSSEEVVFTFRHPEAREREKRFAPTGDTAFDIELLPVGGAPPALPDAGPAGGAIDAGPAGGAIDAGPAGGTAGSASHAGLPGEQGAEDGADGATGQRKEASSRERKKRRPRRRPKRAADGLLPPSF